MATTHVHDLPPITVTHEGSVAELVVWVDVDEPAKSLYALSATGWFTEAGIGALAAHAAGAEQGGD